MNILGTKHFSMICLLAAEQDDSGDTFPFHSGIRMKVGIEAACLLHWLENYHLLLTRTPEYVWNDGWFPCSVDDVFQELCLRRKAQSRLFATLKSLGFVEVAKKGLPGTRHVRVNPNLINETISLWEQDMIRRKKDE